MYDFGAVGSGIACGARAGGGGVKESNVYRVCLL